METVIVTTESQLATVIERVLVRHLEHLKQPQPEQPSTQTSYWSDLDTFDVAEAAEYLEISKSRLWKLSADGKIPCSKFFGRLKFERDDLDTWAASNSRRRGDISSVASTLAESANRKMRSKKHVSA